MPKEDPKYIQVRYPISSQRRTAPKEVNEAIANGYEPLGYPTKGRLYMHLAMVKAESTYKNGFTREEVVCQLALHYTGAMSNLASAKEEDNEFLSLKCISQARQIIDIASTLGIKNKEIGA